MPGPGVKPKPVDKLLGELRLGQEIRPGQWLPTGRERVPNYFGAASEAGAASALGAAFFACFLLLW